MTKPIVAVSGKNGQLGNELIRLAATYAGKFEFLFTGHADLDMTNAEAITHFFEQHKPVFFIHCAAYTAVDKAETERDLAYAVNATAVGLIAKQCSRFDTTLIMLSTDYVFSGNAARPYQPGDPTDPLNYYGYTKREGENFAFENNRRTIVLRTSWVYSDHGHNFVKTMLRLMKERTEINVVSDQLGSPTAAADLASAIMQVVEACEAGEPHYGIYHYSNKTEISWYEFALAIREISGLSCTVHPVATSAYPTPAKRPAYSIMDTSTVEKDFGIIIPDWKESLRACLQKLI